MSQHAEKRFGLPVGKLAMTMMTVTGNAMLAVPLTKAATREDQRWRGVIAWMLKERGPQPAQVLSTYLYRQKCDLPPGVRIVLEHRSFGL